MKTTKQQIVEYISKNHSASVKQLVEHFGIYATIMHRHLKSLIDEGKLQKVGSAPKVLYVINKSHKADDSQILTYKEQEYLENNFYTYDSDGQILKGAEGFIARCEQRKFDIKQQFTLYYSMMHSIADQKDENGLLDGLKYLNPKLGEIYVKDLKFVEAYQVGHFGKSKLGSLTFYAKQSQNKELIKQVIQIIKNPILSYIKENKIDGISFTPPSISRPVQLMTELKKQLKIDLPEIKLMKLFPSGVIIPQKSLKGLEQRMKNSTNTLFIVDNQKAVHKLLIIDDFMGSGATINFSAKKILDAKLAKEVVAITLLGNIDTKYEVINEV
jgi:hypothetical protein